MSEYSINLKSLSDQNLLQRICELAKRERETTLEVLHHLREVERRSLYAVRGYSSLFEYCTQELRYSEGAAQRRISSMRLLKEVPELEEKIEKGSLSLSALSQAQVFFRKEEVKNKEEKKEILRQLENKSKREVERELILRSSEPAKLIPERVRALTPTHTELRFLVEEKTLRQIEELKNLLAHSHPRAGVKDILEYALLETLERMRPKAPKNEKSTATGGNEKKNKEEKSSIPSRSMNRSQTTMQQQKHLSRATKEPSRYTPVELKRKVWARDKGECTYVDRLTGRKCCCRRGLELDHVRPWALGGENTVDNLRLRCRAHNQLAAIRVYGQEKMSRFVPRLRETVRC